MKDLFQTESRKSSSEHSPACSGTRIPKRISLLFMQLISSFDFTIKRFLYLMENGIRLLGMVINEILCF